MSGARLEALGQVRNVFPFAVSVGIRANLVIPVATFIGETPLTVDKAEIPFNLGPDKSSRVYVCLNGLTCSVLADAGITTRISGSIYYRNGGRRIYLGGINQTLNGVSLFNFDCLASHPYPIMSDSVDNIGSIGFDVGQSTLPGTATNVNVVVWVNVGLYGDYAEPDWKKVMSLPKHDHIGLTDWENDSDA